jgi:hypothetical protein
VGEEWLPQHVRYLRAFHILTAPDATLGGLEMVCGWPARFVSVWKFGIMKSPFRQNLPMRDAPRDMNFMQRATDVMTGEQAFPLLSR